MLNTSKATATKTAKGLEVISESRGFKLVMDEPEEMGGTNMGMNPAEALLCALGGCQSIVAAAFAESFGIKFEEFGLEIEGDWEPDGFMGLADVRNGFQEIRYKVHIKTDEPEEKCEEFAKFVASRCPIEDTIANPVKVVMTGVVRD